jgi:hypothetical protein
MKLEVDGNSVEYEAIVTSLWAPDFIRILFVV